MMETAFGWRLSSLVHLSDKLKFVDMIWCKLSRKWSGLMERAGCYFSLSKQHKNKLQQDMFTILTRETKQSSPERTDICCEGETKRGVFWPTFYLSKHQHYLHYCGQATFPAPVYLPDLWNQLISWTRRNTRSQISCTPHPSFITYFFSSTAKKAFESLRTNFKTSFSTFPPPPNVLKDKAALVTWWMRHPCPNTTKQIAPNTTRITLTPPQRHDLHEGHNDEKDDFQKKPDPFRDLNCVEGVLTGWYIWGGGILTTTTATQHSMWPLYSELKHGTLTLRCGKTQLLQFSCYGTLVLLITTRLRLSTLCVTWLIYQQFGKLENIVVSPRGQDPPSGTEVWIWWTADTAPLTEASFWEDRWGNRCPCDQSCDRLAEANQTHLCSVSKSRHKPSEETCWKHTRPNSQQHTFSGAWL